MCGILIFHVLPGEVSALVYTNDMSTAVLSIVSKNYLPFARTLMRSMERCNPSYRRFVVLADTVDGYFSPAAEPFTTIPVSDLPIHRNRWLFFKYSILELNTAIKPYAIEYLMDHYGVSRMIYLDPDIKVYHSLDCLLSRLNPDDILLTPHLLDPIDDGFIPSELDILRSGAYNLGFIAVRANDNTRAFLRWWQNKLLDHCYLDFDRGLFTDQRWMDLAPAMFRNVGILRDPGCNVAYWNLKTRPLDYAPDGRLMAASGPLFFFHFSGLDILSPNELSKHQNRFRLSDSEVLREVVLEYSKDVLVNGYTEALSWPYAYGTFENGAPLSDRLRRFTTESPDLMTRMQEPFSSEAHTEYVNYWNTFVADDSGNLSCITQLAKTIYNKRPDLQTRAPDIFGKDLLWFLDWFVHNVQGEYGVDDILIAPMAAHRDRLFHESGRATESRLPAALSSSARDNVVGLNIVGYLHAEMGVGETSRCAAAAARSTGLQVSLNNFGVTESRQQDTRLESVDNRFLYDVNLFNVNADQTHVLFGHLEKRCYTGKYNIGWWVWELENFPDHWLDAFQYYDEIWTPSAFCRDSIVRKSPIPVIQIPYAIDIDLQRPMSRSELSLPPDKFVFLGFLDVLSVPKRKNLEGVVAAFRESGAGRRGAHLVLKVNNGRLLPHVVEQLEEMSRGIDVTIINETWSRSKVNSLIACCDSLVSLHRSEGFGLTIAEAMYLGKPVIVTAYSGSMDFARPDTALLVDYTLVPVGAGADPYDPNSRWAEPDIGQAAEWIRRVQRDGALRSRIAQSGQNYIREHFSTNSVGNMMRSRLEGIVARNLASKRAEPPPDSKPLQKPKNRMLPRWRFFG